MSFLGGVGNSVCCGGCRSSAVKVLLFCPKPRRSHLLIVCEASKVCLLCLTQHSGSRRRVALAKATKARMEPLCAGRNTKERFYSEEESEDVLSRSIRSDPINDRHTSLSPVGFVQRDT